MSHAPPSLIHPFPLRPAPAPPALLAGQLHEIHADAADWASALCFALGGLAQRANASARPVAIVLVRPCPRGSGVLGAVPAAMPYAPGLAGAGIDPARLVLVETGDAIGLLRAGLDAARCPGVAGVVIESWGRMAEYDLTASRRLVLAAEQSGTGVAVLRGDAPERASAAHSRWHIRSAASRAEPLAAHLPAPPGPAAIEARLLRQRGGTAGMGWLLEWDERDGCFRQHRANAGAAPLSGAVVPLAAMPAGARAA
ncbi:MAG TPA: hypothetical protein VN222_18135 [Novosphingobium sp.]|nr:hypothetical protein [Novosphingobium sp.]